MTGNVVVLGFAAAGAPGFSVPHTATSLVCFLLGAVAGGRVARRLDEGSRLRNATVRKLGIADLTTTVLTMPLTGLASDSRAGGGSGHRSPRRSASVVAMAAGACLGAWLVLHHGLGIPLLVAAVTAGVLAVVASGRE